MTNKTLEDLNGGEEPNARRAIEMLLDSENISGFGLKFLLENKKDLLL